MGSAELMRNAWKARTVIPAFNIPYRPMMRPVVQALRDNESFGLIAVARPDWMKFSAGSLQAICEEYQNVKDERYVRLHLDHVPVIDEDNLPVDYLAIIQEALDAGYQSVMVDGSRLLLSENISAVRKIVEMSHSRGIPVEAELGAVLGHEAGPLPPYEELFASGKGFTDPEQARQFVEETGVDWLSVAVGNIHGAISPAGKDQKKVQARLNIEHLKKIQSLVGIPLVLHGGTGIRKDSVLAGIKAGIAKINIGTAVRQAYEAGAKVSVSAGQAAVYQETTRIVEEELEIKGSVRIVNPDV